MATSVHRIADLEQQAADLTARLERVESYGLALKALIEVLLDPGYGAGPKPSRSRHLMAIQGSEQ
jgi:hypothetical protein